MLNANKPKFSGKIPNNGTKFEMQQARTYILYSGKDLLWKKSIELNMCTMKENEHDFACHATNDLALCPHHAHSLILFHHFISLDSIEQRVIP